MVPRHTTCHSLHSAAGKLCKLLGCSLAVVSASEAWQELLEAKSRPVAHLLVQRSGRDGRITGNAGHRLLEHAVIAITADTGNFQGEMNAIWDKLFPAFQALARPIIPPDKKS